MRLGISYIVMPGYLQSICFIVTDFPFNFLLQVRLYNPSSHMCLGWLFRDFFIFIILCIKALFIKRGTKKGLMPDFK